MFDLITPVILTRNEAPNIGRTLSKLSWARDIVVVDSFSQDETQNILAQFSQVRVFQRTFDNHADQWSFALRETGIDTDWVLALDADYILSDGLIEELGRLAPSESTAGYEASFKYCIHGKTLRGAAYLPVTVLYRRSAAAYHQDGHTQRITVWGTVEKLRAPIYHDDRKPLSHWVQSQIRYMRLEAEKLSASDRDKLGWADRLRLLRVVAPFVMLFYCLFVKGAIFDGKAGVYYAFQRMFAELLLSLFLIENDLGLGKDS
jgi:glycosyltransferase involved in cell wall biosynthesis